MNAGGRLIELFLFRGVMGRRDFWAVIGVLVFGNAVSWLCFPGYPGAFPILVVSLWPYLAAVVRRLRDVGRPPSIVLIPLAVSLVLFSVTMTVMAVLFFGSIITLSIHFYLGHIVAIGVVLACLSAAPQLAFTVWVGVQKGVSRTHASDAPSGRLETPGA